MLTYVFSVGGASASGKSLMADCIKYFLSPYVPVLLMRQDRFYKSISEIEIHPTYLEQNWEIPSALDMDAFHKTLTRIFQAQSPKDLDKLWLDLELHVDGQIRVPNNSNTVLPDWICTDVLRSVLHPILSKLALGKAVIVLVDGFLLHYDASVCAKMHGNVFLSASFETCRLRRSARDGYVSIDGEIWKDPPQYFENLVWPSYLTLNERILKHTAIGRTYEKCNPRFSSERICLDGQETIVLDSNNYGVEGILHNIQLALSFICERVMLSSFEVASRVTD